MKPKKKNTLRPQDITYEPIKEENQPLWMHSMQSYRTKRTTIRDIIAIIAIVGAIILTYAVLC